MARGMFGYQVLKGQVQTVKQGQLEFNVPLVQGSRETEDGGLSHSRSTREQQRRLRLLRLRTPRRRAQTARLAFGRQCPPG
jgi:hypothetical protein